MTEKLKKQQTKYYTNHKQYKVYLSTDEDAELVAKLDKCKNKSLLIRSALLLYFKRGN